MRTKVLKNLGGEKKMEIEQRYAEVVNRLIKQGYEISAIGQFTTSLFLSDFATIGLSHAIEAEVVHSGRSSNRNRLEYRSGDK